MAKYPIPNNLENPNKPKNGLGISLRKKSEHFFPISTKVKNLIEKAKVILWFLAFEITVGTSEIILDGKIQKFSNSFEIQLRIELSTPAEKSSRGSKSTLNINKTKLSMKFDNYLILQNFC